ncbi:hypothetical protein BH10PSE12_BH10PSE12_08010 [soil metagenome]
MSDDFFGALDGKIADLNKAQDARAERRGADQAFSERAILAMRPVADRYVAQLRERGIYAIVGGNERGLTIEMRWADGADHGLAVYPELESGRLKIFRNSTDHRDDRRFRSSDGATYDEASWKASFFEEALKGVINDFMAQAAKHGGITAP